jgi:hypothetical protein
MLALKEHYILQDPDNFTPANPFQYQTNKALEKHSFKKYVD